MHLKNILALTFGVFLSFNTIAQHNNYAKKVNTLIGTKGKGASAHEAYLEAGYTFPGAMYPFGMVQFTPTFFHPNKGFVVNQMSGAGCEHMGNLPLLPLKGELITAPGDMLNYKPNFKVKNAYAGYYEAEDAHGINSALTVTKRTAMGLFQFPNESNKGTFVIGTGLNATSLHTTSVKITSNNSFEGFADGGSFCGTSVNYRVYFVAEFDLPATDLGTWEGDSIKKNNRHESRPGTGVFFTFDTRNSKTVKYKVAISYVSVANARENMKAENPEWDFQKVKQAAISAWNMRLGRIEAIGATSDRTTQFYTHLYHVFGHPNIFNDVNGQYVGGDHEIHKAEGFDYYTAFSNWDTYRTQTQLISMLAPKETSDMMKSLLLFADQSGGGFPRWVLNDTETGIMQGDPTSIVVSVAHAFGADDFDTRKALRIMRNGAENPDAKSQTQLTRPFLKDYIDKGYMNASMMLEYTSADFSIGMFAKRAFNDQKLCDTYVQRAQKWKNLYRPETKWLNSRNEDGSWKKQDEDWREASYKNYFWMVPYNLKGLIDTIGGKDFAEKRLDEFFRRLDASYSQEWFAAGNEPDFQAPWIYNWTNAPYKTQELVKRIIKEQYSNKNSGLPGNDDLGAMGAWYVFANIGLYPMIPGVAGFSINSPSFKKIKIHLRDGVLKIRGGNQDIKYVKSLTLNQKKHDASWIDWSELKDGAVLKFKLSDVVNKNWGLHSAPPSYN